MYRWRYIFSHTNSGVRITHVYGTAVNMYESTVDAFHLEITVLALFAGCLFIIPKFTPIENRTHCNI